MFHEIYAYVVYELNHQSETGDKIDDEDGIELDWNFAKQDVRQEDQAQQLEEADEDY